MWSTSSLPSIPGLLWPGVAALDASNRTKLCTLTKLNCFNRTILTLILRTYTKLNSFTYTKMNSFTYTKLNSFTYTKLKCLIFNLALNDSKRVDTP